MQGHQRFLPGQFRHEVGARSKPVSKCRMFLVLWRILAAQSSTATIRQWPCASSFKMQPMRCRLGEDTTKRSADWGLITVGLLSESDEVLARC